MKKLLTVALGAGTLYILLLRSIANFITRGIPDYLKAMEQTDADTLNADDIQTRREFLHR